MWDLNFENCPILSPYPQQRSCRIWMIGDFVCLLKIFYEVLNPRDVHPMFGQMIG
jgi:hypothetical protein